MEVLLDVRLVPWSQRPEYRKQALARELNKVGIEYVHLKSAGNPFRPKRGESKSIAQCVRDYKRHLKSSPEVLQSFADATRNRRSAVLCFEAKHDECHRSVLLTALTAGSSHIEVKMLAPTTAATAKDPKAHPALPFPEASLPGGNGRKRPPRHGGGTATPRRATTSR